MTVQDAARGVEWLDESEARAWRAWLAMSELVRARVARDLLVETGLSDADYAVLVHLSEEPDEAMRMTDLASRLIWSRSRLSHQVGRMAQRGLVCRRGCPSDARGSFAVLTAEGRAEIARAAPHHVASVRRCLFDVLTPSQVTDLADMAGTVRDHLLATDETAG